MAVLLKSLMYLGYFPEIEDVPSKVLTFMAKQLDVFKKLLASFVYVRTGDVADNVIKMFIDLIHRMDFESEQELDQQLLRDLKMVEGKVQMLLRIAKAVVKEPSGTIREVIFSEVTEEKFNELLAEHEATGDRFRTFQQKLVRRKYVYYYQRMLPLVLENLTFRSNNQQYQPVIDALNLMKRYLNSELHLA